VKSLARLSEGREVLLAQVEAKTDSGSSCWLLPLSVTWEDEPTAALPAQLALARVRRGRRVGLLTDAFSLPNFAHQMLASLAASKCIDVDDGSIRFDAAPQAREMLRRPADAPVLWITAEQSNSSLIVDDAIVLKIFRRISPGHHPEAEMSRYLTERGFANAPPLLGEVCHVDKKGERSSLAVALGFVRNQGDAWTWSLDRFNRAVDDLATQEAAARADDITDYLAIATAIGQRLGEMHTLLAQPTENPAFAPGRATADDVKSWVAHAESLLSRALEAIRDRKTWEDDAAAAQANWLVSKQEALFAALRRRAVSGEGALITRIHGDFHLGQVLVASGDVHIIDFEGEPARPLAERRAKTTPLRDVAGLLRSLDYAAAATLAPKTVSGAPVADETRREFVTRLRDRAHDAFLAAYRSATDSLSGLTNSDLLDLFVLEKAAYEVLYEAANRPAWMAIPMRDLADLAVRVSAKPRRTQ